MASNIVVSTPQRITASATWTEITAASPAAGKETLVDVIITNFDADAATVMYAIKSSAPSADTDANDIEILDGLPAALGDAGHKWTLSSLLIPDGSKLYVKSDQTDTRVTCSGYKQTVP
jgi:hypothetical protein